jgi:hypothetical protein
MLCPICQAHELTRGLMCEPCGESYDRYAHAEGTHFEAMRWAAQRARRFERRRARRLAEKARKEAARVRKAATAGFKFSEQP